MDHIQGLGFFDPLHRADSEVHIWGPPSTTLDLRARLARYLSPPLFPVLLRELPSHPVLHDVPPRRFEVGGFKISADLVCHPGPTVGYRISEGPVTVTYLPDHEPALGVWKVPLDPDWTSGFALAAGADLLIHDAQFTDAEYVGHVGWGHSSIRQAMEFASGTGVKRLIPFHHDPSHGDEMLERLLDATRTSSVLPFELLPGTEGTTLRL